MKRLAPLLATSGLLAAALPGPAPPPASAAPDPRVPAVDVGPKGAP
ncbi:hypothetical protein AB0940_25075 [Streptomyces sp. NPDC006656]